MFKVTFASSEAPTPLWSQQTQRRRQKPHYPGSSPELAHRRTLELNAGSIFAKILRRAPSQNLLKLPSRPIACRWPMQVPPRTKSLQISPTGPFLLARSAEQARQVLPTYRYAHMSFSASDNDGRGGKLSVAIHFLNQQVVK